MRAILRSILLILIGGVIGMFAGRTADRPGPAAPRAAAAAPLKVIVSEMAFDGTPLHEVLDRICADAGVDLIVRWHRLGEIGIEPEMPVTLQLRNVELDRVLK